jgi:polyisoprenoid-binding protein YceI
MTFTSTGMIHNGSSVELGGLLTIKGVTRPVTLRGEFLGSAKGTDGRRHMGFEAKTTIDRRPYGLTYNRLNDGFALVGNDATITILLEAVEVPRVPMK